MSVTSLLRPDARTSRDRLEVLTALMNAPSFDPLPHRHHHDPALSPRLPLELPGH